jgi:hypothetical protein
LVTGVLSGNDNKIYIRTRRNRSQYAHEAQRVIGNTPETSLFYLFRLELRMTARQSTLLVWPDMNYFLRGLVDRLRAGARPPPGSNSISDWLLVAAIGLVLLAALPVHAAGLCTIGIADYACTVLNVPGSSSTRANGINNTGQITGYYELTGTHTYTYASAAGTYSAVADPAGSSATYAYGINDSGQLAGYSVNSTAINGFVRTGSTYSTIAAPGATNTYAFGIDSTGQVVGAYENASGTAQGFLWNSGLFSTFAVPGANATYAYGINNSGEVAGTFTTAAGLVAGFTLSNGNFVTKSVPGATQTFVRGLNNWGDLVGNYVDSLGTHGFAWLATGQFWSFDIVGATSTDAQSINDARQIAGYYQTGSSTQGFIAVPKPIPLPATLPLLAAGLVVVLRGRQSRSA